MIMKLVNEVWKDVVGFEGYYQVSNYGRVKSADRVVKDSKGRKKPIKGAMIVGSSNSRKGVNDYQFIQLRKNGEMIRKYVHRLVAEAFLPNPFNYPQVNHIDGDKTNNQVDNLEFCSQSANIQHAYDTGAIKCKISDSDARYICQVYTPKDPFFGQSALAKKFGVSNAAIYMVVKGINKSKATESIRNSKQSDIA